MGIFHLHLWGCFFYLLTAFQGMDGLGLAGTILNGKHLGHSSHSLIPDLFGTSKISPIACPQMNMDLPHWGLERLEESTEMTFGEG